MNDDDLFIALVLAATSAGHPDPLTQADTLLKGIIQLRIMRTK